MNVTLTLNEQEVNALVGLMDAGVKALGLQSAMAAAVLAQKIDEARKAAADAPKEQQPE